MIALIVIKKDTQCAYPAQVEPRFRRLAWRVPRSGESVTDHERERMAELIPLIAVLKREEACTPR